MKGTIAMRRATVSRITRETNIHVRLGLDQRPVASIRTGAPFLDHMLTLFSTHGAFALSVRAKGDLKIDIHHTNEDIGLALGEAFSQALGDYRGIRRYGWAYVPMDEALARVVLDISGRPRLVIRDHGAVTKLRSTGTSYQWWDLEHWLESFARTARVTIHVDLFAGRDLHHACEAVMKALGRAMRQAVELDTRLHGSVPSSKGRV